MAGVAGLEPATPGFGVRVRSLCRVLHNFIEYRAVRYFIGLSGRFQNWPRIFAGIPTFRNSRSWPMPSLNWRICLAVSGAGQPACDFTHFNSSGRPGMVAARFLQFLPTPLQPPPEAWVAAFSFASWIGRCRRCHGKQRPGTYGARGAAEIEARRPVGPPGRVVSTCQAD